MTKLSSRFKNAPGENDTRIKERRECTLGDYDVLFGKSSWDGSTTLVFCTKDIATMKHRDLEAFVRDSLIVKEGSEVTIKRTEDGFTIVNFNVSLVTPASGKWSELITRAIDANLRLYRVDENVFAGKVDGMEYVFEYSNYDHEWDGVEFFNMHGTYWDWMDEWCYPDIKIYEI